MENSPTKRRGPLKSLKYEGSQIRQEMGHTALQVRASHLIKVIWPCKQLESMRLELGGPEITLNQKN